MSRDPLSPSLVVLGAIACTLGLAAVLAPVLAPEAEPEALALDSASIGGAIAGEGPFELVLFGTSRDDEHLDEDSQPLVVHQVPKGWELWLTDVDATTVGLALLRRSGQTLEQVGFVVDRPSVGRGQSARSYRTAIRFGPGDELLIEPAGGDVEWLALRGVVRPLATSLAWTAPGP